MWHGETALGDMSTTKLARSVTDERYRNQLTPQIFRSLFKHLLAFQVCKRHSQKSLAHNRVSRIHVRTGEGYPRTNSRGRGALDRPLKALRAMVLVGSQGYLRCTLFLGDLLKLGAKHALS
jgi:hypothetical protein